MSALQNFQNTPLGRRLRPIVEDRTNVRDMIALSRIDVPAVTVIGRQVAELGRELRDHTVKRFIGRWVREAMEARGWTPARIGRVPPGNHFTTGGIYKPRSKQ